MASDSPRTRVDQFFASKKRKSLSPGLKHGRTQKEARIVLESSPSGKGNLDNYLVSSQDDKPSYTHRGGSVALEDPVKRSLALKINRVSEDGSKEQLLLAQLDSQTIPEGGETVQKETSQGSSNAGIVAKRLEHGGENLELKQFAMEYLSLYCSELKSTATSPSKAKLNDHKRHSSSLLSDGENKTTRKRNCMVNRLLSEGETACSDEQITEISKTGDSILKTLKEVDAGSDSVQLQHSLRKCIQLSASKVNMTECSTPSPSIVKACVRETPKSTRGSSLFSPGEEFWNEAIQIADGLSVADFPLNNVAEKVNCASCNDKSKEILDKAGSNAPHICNCDSLELRRMHMKNSVKEVSPLPVKHLDFLFEDKNMDANASTGARDDLNMNRGGEHPENIFVNIKGSQTSNLAAFNIEAHTNDMVHEVQKITSVYALTKSSEDLPKQNTDSIKSDSPVNHIKYSGGNDNHCEAETPSSFMPIKDSLDLSNWLPSEVCSIYKRRGISKLYPWQVDCLQVEGVLQRRNLVYCASTSAGKSFVAEILMLRQVISTGKIALLVLPYVSICAEKAEHLEGLLEPLGKQVRSFFGNQGGATLPKDTSVAVCTIEKANSLINRLLEESRLSEIGIIVIDELHMVGDQSRGYLLELMLTKLRYAAGEGNSESSSGESSGTSSKSDPSHSLQIVGMSATMPNVAAVADWLQAALYQTDFRPVPLEEYIKVGNTIYDKKMDIVRTIPRAADLGGKDPDHIVELCNEVVQEGHSVLIFCSSRKGCESTARHISKFLRKFSISSPNDGEFVDITAAIDALRRCPAGLDPTLEETLPCGVAYHHAGLTVEEREIVETCYRRGLLRILTATSTLAAGVNLPARRVIFRQPRIGRDFIDGTRYRQMSGRAGRTGIDTRGESVLICKADELKRIMGLLNESCPPLQSCLSEDKNGMTHAILEVVAGGIVQTANDIHRYVRCTLLNSTKPFRDVVRSAQDSLRWLCHKKFLEWNEDTKLYNITPLGRASFGSSLCPEESLIVLDDLSRAREGFVLASDLHLVYLVTPINVDVDPDWDLYYGRFMELSSLDQSVGNRVGVSEPFLMRMAHGAPLRTLNKSTTYAKGSMGKFETRPGIANNSSDEQTVRVCKRFYVSLILSRLVQEVPIAEVCEAFKVARGMVQALQDNAGRFASMVSLFCERLGWHDIEGLVSKFQNRVSFGVRAEIVELTTIPYVKGSRARAFYKAGLRTPLAIAEASIPEIAKALFESSSWAAQEGTAPKRIQLGVAKKIKNGARKIVLDKAEEARVAAFSAFKSLGLSVPQFSLPLLSNASDDNPAVHGDAGVLPGDNRFLSVEQIDRGSSKLSVDARADSGEVSGTKGDRSTKLDVDPVAPVDEMPSGALQSQIVAEGTILANGKDLIVHSEIDACNDQKNCASSILFSPSKQISNGPRYDGHFDSELQEARCREIKDGPSEKGPITVSNAFGGFDSFLDLWSNLREFFFDIHYNKRSEVNSAISFEIHGIAVCWENSPVYYVNLPKDLLCSDNKRQDSLATSESGHRRSSVVMSDNCFEIFRHRWSKIIEIMGKREVRKFTWNLKVQIQVLKSAGVSIHRFGSLNLSGKTLGPESIDGSHVLLSPVSIKGAIDLCIVAWILWPDEERSSNSNLDKEAKKRLSTEAIAAANRSGRWKNQTRRAAHNGCCRRVAQSRALHSVLWKLIISERLDDALENIEIPLVNVLADMELWGIGVDMEGCLQARNVLGKKLRHLERKAYELAGMTFSLYTAADIANVLYGKLKLPVPEGHEGKRHPSTDKHCLDLLRHEHPIVPVIKEHRKLAKLLNCTLGSICSLARLSMRTQKYTLHGHWLQTSTATGRLSMEEPNLQCVEHMVDFEMSTGKDGCDAGAIQYSVNARDFFIPTQENWLLLTADYSQIELRLMAHFSKDASLVELLSKPHGDVFTMIAARWTGQPEDSVSSVEREQTKRLVYGILYGMGANTLSEQLDCSSDEAAEKIKSFKSSFPGVSSWLHEAVGSCRIKGYIETLKGRKRFLSKIKFGNSKEKSKAQRQAVNSICQGSAADIIKIAMIKIHSVIAENISTPDCSSSLAVKFHMLKGRCRILLQVHDELVLEVDPSVIKEATLLLQMSMESAAVLLVPLQVKLKVGRTWGSLEAFQADQLVNEIPVPDS